MSKPTVTLHSRVSQIPGSIATNLADNIALLNISTGNYFSLDDIGSRIWPLLQTPQGVSSLCGRVLAEYKVDRSRGEADIVAFLQSLVDAKLVQIHPD